MSTINIARSLGYLVLTGVVVTIAAAPASAQTHPCDGAAPTQVTVNSNGTFAVAFCSPASDQIQALTVYLDGVASDLRAVTQVTNVANAEGEHLYQGPRELQFPVGTHEVTISVWNYDIEGGVAQESPRSAPLALSAIVGNPAPRVPEIRGVVR